MLIGRLAQDPEARVTPSGQNVVTVRLATNRTWNDRASGQKREQVEFHTIVIWGALADVASKYLKKGQLAYFEGRLQTRTWQDTANQKHYRTEIVAEAMQLGPKAAGTGGSTDTSMRTMTPRTAPGAGAGTSNKNTTPAEQEEEIPIINEDVPTSHPGALTGETEEAEIDLKDIPF